jgi:crotonobetainyl-CoA:carnitine CoA-transferase CaiB-like acyl-CoA transferase
MPFLSATPGRTDWPGPELGAHNAEVLEGLLGYSAEELAAFRDNGVI